MNEKNQSEREEILWKAGLLFIGLMAVLIVMSWALLDAMARPVTVPRDCPSPQFVGR